MSENRYSLITVAKYLGLTTSTVHFRAKKLKINTQFGLSVHDVKLIAEYMRKPKTSIYKTTTEDLRKEMEETYRE